ncbi:MAG: sodium:proton antiporter [Alphaproteobacteria bacterium]|nr:sodium:proton antiporter [Alphaproteobacteria bacterium]
MFGAFPQDEIYALGTILLVAAIVAMLTRRLHLPYTAGLVAVGLLLAVAGVVPHVRLTPNLILLVLLPPLVFEAAVNIPWHDFRKDLPVIVSLAVGGVAVTAASVAAGMYYIIGWQWQPALLFGMLIAATDPVSVIATFREHDTEKRLKLLVESESLLNDGIAATGFSVCAAIVAGEHAGPGSISIQLLWTTGGGILCGLGVSVVCLLIAGRTTDHLIEITLTTIAAYGSYMLADHFGMSGILAALTAGLVVGNRGPERALSEFGRDAVHSFWEYAAFLANSVIFLLIGAREATLPILVLAGATAVATGLTLLGRAAAVYPVTLLFNRTALAVKPAYRHVLVWGGLRGALALALALSLDDSVPQRGAVISVAFAVVAISIFVQGCTMAPLLKHLHLLRGGEGEAQDNGTES